MNDNGEIAQWILDGKLPKNLNPVERKAYDKFAYLPKNQKMNDQGAVLLLPVLVERGYVWRLESDPRGFYFYTRDAHVIGRMFESIKPTIAKAIIDAILQLVERGK